MPLKKFRPNTPGTRGLSLLDRKGLWTGKPMKSLTKGLPKKSGRNNSGIDALEFAKKNGR